MEAKPGSVECPRVNCKDKEISCESEECLLRQSDGKQCALSGFMERRSRMRAEESQPQQ